jgi:hypothetical protein
MPNGESGQRRRAFSTADPSILPSWRASLEVRRGKFAFLDNTLDVLGEALDAVKMNSVFYRQLADDFALLRAN